MSDFLMSDIAASGFPLRTCRSIKKIVWAGYPQAHLEKS